MAIARITSAEFENQLRTAILDRNPDLDCVTGPIRDTIVAPTSVVCEDQNERIRRLSLIMSLINVGEFTDVELDEVAFNEGVLRRPGTRATTTVFFQTRRAPTVDITVPINFPLTTPVDPTLNRGIIFRTSETRTLPAATAALYFNAGSGFYELEVNVQAINAGEDGNVAVGKISSLQSTISGFEQVTNRAASSGGKDQETNEEMAERLIVAIAGTDISTKFGIEKEVLDTFADVSDIEEVFGLDPLLERAADDAGAVDAYVIGSVPVVHNESAIFLGRGQPIVLENQPVLSVASVDAGGPVFVQGTDYEFVPDTGVNAGSVRAQDAIVFIAGGAVPAIGATLDITYNSNSLMQTMQDSFIEPEKLVFGRDLLFKQGTQIDIEVEADLSILAGANSTVIQSAVLSTIVTFINSLGLGDDVELSDINAEVRKLSGVDNLVFTTFRILGSVDPVEDISIARSEYARIQAGNVTINL